MNLTVRILGAEVLHVTTDPTSGDDEPGDSTAYAIGFTGSTDLPIREPGRDLE